MYEVRGRPRSWRPLLHEAALLLLGLGTVIGLAVRIGPLEPLTCEVAAGTLVLAVTLFLLSSDVSAVQKARLAAAYGFIIWFYLAVERVVPALGLPLRDNELRDADEFVFRCLPAQAVQRYSAPWLTDLLSAGYAGYLLYLNLVLIDGLWRPAREVVDLGAHLFTAFAIGLAGYLLVPALGPWKAFPDLFTMPAAGGMLTELNAALVARGSSRFDVFPSLHVLVTCVLLDHDRRFAVRRFRIMVLPAATMVLATVYLRYHYVVDIVAGVVVFLLVRWLVPRGLRKSLGTDTRCGIAAVTGSFRP